MIKQNLLEDAYELGINYAQTEHEFKEHIKTHGAKFAKEFGAIISQYQAEAIDEFNEKHEAIHTHVICHKNSACVVCFGDGERFEYTFTVSE